MKIAMTGLRAIGQAPAAPGSGEGGAVPNLDLFSGVEKAVEEISVRLAARGHEVTVFCRVRYNPAPLTLYRGVRLVNLPAVYSKHLEAFSHTFLASLHAMRGYNVVHFHATGPALFSGLPRLAGTRTVATVHGLDWQREKWRGFAKLVLRAGAWAAGHFPDRTIVVSQPLQEFYARTYRRDTVYIPNGVDPAEPAAPDLIRRFGVGGGDYVLFLSRLVPEKGCHFLIRAFRRLSSDLKLLLVGGGSYSDDYVASLRREAGGDPRIVFTGALYGREKAEVLGNARCMVLPSTLEGMPIVMLEAMSAGSPVLCSDIPVNRDIAAPEGDPAAPYACLFKSASEDSLLERLSTLLSDREAAERRAQAAREYVTRTFSWDRIAEQTEAVYKSVCP